MQLKLIQMNPLLKLQYEMLMREEIERMERRLRALQQFMDANGIPRREVPRQFSEGAVPGWGRYSNAYGKD